MILQIVPWDISVSGVLRLKSINEKREGCSSDTWAKQRSPVSNKKKTKTDEAEQSQSNPTHSAQPLFISARYKTTHSHSLQPSFLPRLSVSQWVSCQPKSIMQVMEHHSLRNPAHSSSERHLWNQTLGQNKGRPVHPLHKWAGCTSCATWVRASWVPLQSFVICPQHSPADRFYKAQLISDTNWLFCFCTTSVDFI